MTATRPLIATYRLQLNAQFTLHDARVRVPYLQRLGISHLYCSPVLAAQPGSTHGYDVADPTQVSRELGGDEAFLALAEAAHVHGMGLVLDIVPNHMGVGPANPFWDDLLAHGPRSRYASWFDVEWRATTRRLAGKVLLPVLGDTLDTVVARDEITVRASDQGVRIHYFDHHFPVDPTTLPPELELAMRDPSARALLPGWTTGAAGRARLRALLARQHYELAFWRLAQRDLNYRRFFDVNELISLRVEQEEVFDATHRLVLQFVADGTIDGLRVDHIDGLLEPRRYLERLRAAVDARRPVAGAGARFPILVEKILAADEALRDDWPVDGTTGYEFMTALEDVFIDPAGYERLASSYRSRPSSPDFYSVALDAKRRVLRAALNADVRRIAPMLAKVARRASWPAQSIACYAGAIVELTAVLPVYRTYLDAERSDAGPADRRVLEASFARVRARGEADGAGIDALERALLGPWANAAPEAARARLAFVLRWQQLTGPAAAKGVEDTALYIYAPLASRNEVGGDPGVPVEGAVARLHARLAERASHHPRSLNATNTHDTKRSADVRSRLDALSENPTGWERRLRRWRRHHRGLRTLVAGRLAPTRTTDNFIYQALVGLWPIGAGVRATDDVAWLGELRERLTAYIAKAVREAKVRTSWTDPDAEYEGAITRFIAAMLDRERNARFLHDVVLFVHEVAAQGHWNAVARLVVHLTAPGTPDLYQGDELPFHALVDPDNRRPVDWARREQTLDQLASLLDPPTDVPPERLADWCSHPGAESFKMYLTARLLHVRHATGSIMSDISRYEPITVRGEHAECVLSYSRPTSSGGQVVVVPRLTHRMVHGGAPIGAAWADTRLVLPGSETTRRWRCALSGQRIESRQGSSDGSIDGSIDGHEIRLADLLVRLPVALLVPEASLTP